MARTARDDDRARPRAGRNAERTASDGGSARRRAAPAPRRRIRADSADGAGGADGAAGGDNARPAAPASAGGDAPARMAAPAAARAGLRQIVELTGKEPEGVTAVKPADGGWVVGVEVVEDRRIPSSSDILSVYEAELDASGDLTSYRRVRRYARGRGGDDEA